LTVGPLFIEKHSDGPAGLVESPLDEEDPRTAFTFDVVVRWRMA